ncbi:MAG: response regulator [Aristaeellaceae bacterium]
MKLLVVDDQHSVHMYLQKALDFSAMGFDDVLHAQNGVQALALIRAHRPQIMLLDIQMPQMNGLQLLEALRREGIPCPETIVLTAYNEFDYAKRCIEFGVSRYVLKPIDPQEITALLTEAFQTVSARRTQHYRWMFPLCCAQMETGGDPAPLPVGSVDPMPYGVVCLRERDASRAQAACIEAIARCAREGKVYLLIAVPSQETWEAFIARLAVNLRTDGIPAGVSYLHTVPSEMTAAAAEARDGLNGSFYAPDVRQEGSVLWNPLTLMLRNSLQMIQDSVLQEDENRLCEQAEQAFALFARANADPREVLSACRDVLFRLHVSRGEAAEYRAWPEGGAADSAEGLQEAFIEELLGCRRQLEPGVAGSGTETIGLLRAYIDGHCGEDLSLSEMAAKFYLSRYQISRLFKQVVGVNYQDYVLGVRMKEAARRLKYTDERLYEIARAVGFDEPSYFSNVFKKTYGLSPRAYRLAEKEKKT